MAIAEILIGAAAIVEITAHDAAPVDVICSAPAVVEVASEGVQGPRGPQGPAGDSSAATRIEVINAATWNLPHALGRVPAVQVFLLNGEMILANVVATASTVNVTFPEPTSGFVLIS